MPKKEMDGFDTKAELKVKQIYFRNFLLNFRNYSDI